MTQAARTPSLRALAAKHRRAIEACTGINLRSDDVTMQEIMDAPRARDRSAWPSPDPPPDSRSDAEITADLRAFKISDEDRGYDAERRAEKERLRRLAWRRAKREYTALRPKAKAPAKRRANGAPTRAGPAALFGLRHFFDNRFGRDR